MAHEPQVMTMNFPTIMALEPAADRYNTDPATDIINLTGAGGICFLLLEGAGGTGTVKITAEACSDIAAGSTTQINFVYRVASNSGTVTDVFGTAVRTTVAADGYTTVAGANKMVEVYIDSRDLPDAKPYIRLKLTEVVNSPCAAAVIAQITEPRYREVPMPTVLT